MAPSQTNDAQPCVSPDFGAGFADGLFAGVGGGGEFQANKTSKLFEEKIR
jgi:hypothetical protein